jgi:hypothetical protein
MADPSSSARRRPLPFAALAGLIVVGLAALVPIALGLSSTPVASEPSAPSAPSAAPAMTGSPDATDTGSPAPPRSARPLPSASSSLAPTQDPLLAGLLTESDLPGLASPLGPSEGAEFDIDGSAFEANGGIRVVSRTWQSLADSGLAAVFDFRMQFPTDAAASAYLEAAEPVLSEATATGQRAIASPPVVGADSRVYGLETTGDGGTVLLRTYLFRVGPVVAKLVAGGTGVDAATTDALARSAAERMLAAGPPVPGSPRPRATASPTPMATRPLPTGEALAALLLEHVPPAIAEGCIPDEQRLWPGELMTLACTDPSGGVTVTYSGFESAEAVEAAIDASLADIDVSVVAPACDLGTYVGPYQVEGEEVGRVVCWPEQGGQAIMWSDDRLAMLAVAVSPTLDAAGLYLWWLEAGPIL